MNKLGYQKIITELSCNRNVEAVILFGSCATKKDKPYSDIDLCVITSPKATSDGLNEILSFSSRKIDLSLFIRLPLYIQYRVMKEGKVLFVRDSLRLHRIKVNTILRYLDFKPLIERYLNKILAV